MTFNLNFEPITISINVLKMFFIGLFSFSIYQKITNGDIKLKKSQILDVILILLASFLAPSIAATFGLLVNLKYPKMDASSDSEVVKQSMSSMVAVLGGIVFAILFIVLTFILAVLGDFAMIVDVVLLGLILLVLWKILAKYGKKRYKEIQI